MGPGKDTAGGREAPRPRPSTIAPARGWGPPATLALTLVFFAGLVLSRRPDVVTSPQFWAEDGMEWFSRAYNFGPWEALMRPYGGYYQLFPRLTGALATHVGLEWAPLVMNVVALLLQAMVPTFLTSERFAHVVAGRWRRLVLGVLLVAAPNLFEVHVNATNGHIHLAMLAFLVILAQPTVSRAWRGFDVVVLLLSGLSGPFCILLVPVAVVRWRQDRHPWSLVRLLVVLGTATIQASSLASRGRMSRRLSGTRLGASSASLFSILGGQVFVGGLLGLRTYGSLHELEWFGHPWIPKVIGIVGLAFLARVAWLTRSRALRLLLLFALLHLAASLFSPIVAGGKPAWELLQLPAAGMRYYYFAIVAFLASVAWTLVGDPRRPMRVLAMGLLALLLLVGVRRDWRLPYVPDRDYRAQVARFRAAPAGKRVPFEIAPPPWQMVLIRP